MTALEIDPSRTKLIRETLDRLGLVADIHTADAADVKLWWNGIPYDHVLLDAPCTASGIVRRQPDVPWSRRPADINALAARQKRLLDALWPVVRSGGTLLFCTCSIFPEEGPQQAESFLKRHPDAVPVPIGGNANGMMILTPAEAQTSSVNQHDNWEPQAEPPVHDGFFYALLEKGLTAARSRRHLRNSPLTCLPRILIGLMLLSASPQWLFQRCLQPLRLSKQPAALKRLS